MNEVDFDYWLDEIVPSVGGAQIPFVLRQIREAAIKFCEKSWAWHLDALPIPVTSNDAKYRLVSPIDKAEIVKLIHVYLDGEEITVKSWTELNGDYIDATTLKGEPKHYVQGYVEDLTLFPIPTKSGILSYQVALRPSRVANGMNGSVAKRYYDAIADGVKAKMFEIPNKPWSDGAAAVYHRNLFDMACQMAKDEVISGLGRGPRRNKLFY